ncbi:hypothetical protein LSH36_380g03014 [Paralvinella palmiformis]|uniref:Uncharacterized protein n=1 Tax=Paralvinella palmiformis TaxID=53620 RepID=A0AAD9JDL1_9ANNE|nr:hypothetical protein LSH36_380g03014 [Paralvinella palmiformis]
MAVNRPDISGGESSKAVKRLAILNRSVRWSTTDSFTGSRDSDIVNSLECFTCDEEDWNHKDCTHRRQQCDAYQDACTTYIRYGVPDKFNARNYRRYFISKGCDTRMGCEKRLGATTPSCQKSYYNDWACVECCTVDSCNFHVSHLGAGSIRANILVTMNIKTGHFTDEPKFTELVTYQLIVPTVKFGGGWNAMGIGRLHQVHADPNGTCYINILDDFLMLPVHIMFYGITMPHVTQPEL